MARSTKRDSEERVAKRLTRRIESALVTNLAGVAESVADERHFGPLDASEASQELNPGSGEAMGVDLISDLLETAHASAAARSVVFNDHVRSTANLMTRKGLGVYSVWTTARAALEAAGVIYWLTEPGIRPYERVGRSLNDRLRSIQESAKFGREVFGEDREQASRFEELVNQAESLGMQVVGEGWNRSVEKNRPDRIDLVASLLGPEAPGVYRLFAGASHGELWGVIQSMRDKPTIPDPRGRESIVLVRPGITVAEYWWIADNLRLAYRNAFGRLVRYMGWNQQRWEAGHDEAQRLLRKVADDLGKAGAS